MNIGKKILSALVEVADEKKPATATEATARPAAETTALPENDTGKFRQHFEQLFAEANQPGPDYYEFAKMVEAMTVIADEKARYLAAFAGLGVQGLDKQKLLSTAAAYLKLVEEDAAAFQQTLTAMLKEKVQEKQEEVEEKSRKIQQLSQEITELHNRISGLQHEIRENEEKIAANSTGYQQAAESMKEKIIHDMEKIKQYVS